MSHLFAVLKYLQSITQLQLLDSLLSTSYTPLPLFAIIQHPSTSLVRLGPHPKKITHLPHPPRIHLPQLLHPQTLILLFHVFLLPLPLTYPNIYISY